MMSIFWPLYRPFRSLCVLYPAGVAILIGLTPAAASSPPARKQAAGVGAQKIPLPTGAPKGILRGAGATLTEMRAPREKVSSWHRLTSKQPNPKPWEVAAKFPINAPVERGDVLVMRVWLRAPECEDTCPVYVDCNRLHPPFSPSILTTRNAGKQWQLFEIPFVSTVTAGSGELAVSVSIGHRRQVVDIGPVDLVSFKKSRKIEDVPVPADAYGGCEPTARWREQAHRRIEQLRTGAMVIRVVDSAGAPVAGADVSVDMKRHAFGFGGRYQYLIHSNPQVTDRHRELYHRRFKQLFTTGTVGGGPVWRVYASNPDRAMTPVVKALAWMRDNGIAAVFYHNAQPGQRPGFYPVGVPPLITPGDVDRFARASNAYLLDKSGHLRGIPVRQWIFANEYVNTGVSDADARLLIRNAFREVKRLHPEALLGITEHRMISRGSAENLAWYENTIRDLIDSGIVVDRVGFQCHFTDELPAIPEALAVFDRFSAIHPGIRLQINEFDCLTSHPGVGLAYMRDFFIACFSHPAMAELIVWDDPALQSGARPNWSLFRADGSLTPAGLLYEELVLKQWWTNKTLKTGKNGQCEVRGFLGEYDIGVRHAGVETRMQASLTKQGATIRVALPGPSDSGK